MPKIAPIPWKKFEKFVLFVGCSFVRQRGDHMVYWREGLNRPVVFPKDKELPVFVIRNNIRVLSISQSEYLEILKRI